MIVKAPSLSHTSHCFLSTLKQRRSIERSERVSKTIKQSVWFWCLVGNWSTCSKRTKVKSHKQTRCSFHCSLHLFCSSRQLCSQPLRKTSAMMTIWRWNNSLSQQVDPILCLVSLLFSLTTIVVVLRVVVCVCSWIQQVASQHSAITCQIIALARRLSFATAAATC